MEIYEANRIARSEARAALIPFTEYDAWDIQYRGLTVEQVRARAEEEAKRIKENDKRIATERRVVRHFIRTAKAAGFDVHSVDNGDERIKVRNETEAMEHVFSVDEARIFFAKAGEPDRKRETLCVVLGNGAECFSDMSGGREDWDAVVETSSRYIDAQSE